MGVGGGGGGRRRNFRKRGLMGLTSMSLTFAKLATRTRMHHKVVGNFGSEADVRSLYYSRFRFNETSDVGAYTHVRPAK